MLDVGNFQAEKGHTMTVLSNVHKFRFPLEITDRNNNTQVISPNSETPEPILAEIQGSSLPQHHLQLPQYPPKSFLGEV